MVTFRNRAHAVRRSLAAVAAGALAVAALPAPSVGAVDAYDVMREGWVERIAGGAGFDPADEPFATEVARVTAIAEDHRDSLVLPPAPEPWPDLSTATAIEDTLTAYRRVHAMALAYRTHGSSLEGDPALLAELEVTLDWLEANRYSASTPPTASWWHLEIGIPLELIEITALLYDELSAAQVTAYMNAVNQFSPSVTGTGANRVWKAMVIAGRGVLVKSSSALSAARTGVVPALAIVGSGDGFHADGSFVQHSTYAYTGGYGLAFMTSLVDLLTLLDGSAWEVTDPAVGNVYDWLAGSFDPFFFRGAVMDAVRGREISRPSGSDHEAGARLIQAGLMLSTIAPSTEAAWMRPMIKQWLQSETHRDVFANGALFGLLTAEQLLADSAVTARAELAGNFMFPGMARVAHHRAGYAFGVSLISQTTSNYESINGENLRGWYTGDGMTSLYTDDVGQYSDHYWPTVNPYRLPGTTVDTQSRSAASGAGYVNPNWFSGGVTSESGAFGVAGLSLDAYGNSLFAQKSWFLFGDEIVALGSAINNAGQSGNGWDGSARRVETTVDNRKLIAPSQVLRVDGPTVATTPGTVGTAANPTWAHISGVGTGGVGEVGYYFPGPGAVRYLRENRTGTWNAINTTYGDTTVVDNDFLAMWFDHGTNPSGATYQYVILPNKSVAETQTYVAAPNAVVLENTAEVHAVEETGLHLVAANFWRDQLEVVSAGGTPVLSSTKKASVLLEERSGGGFSIAVSDPTRRNTGTIELEIFRPSTGLVTASPGVTVTQLSPTVKLSINVAATNSAGRTAVLN